MSARVLAYGRMIKFSHSIFALPFALASAVLAAQGGIRPRASCSSSSWRCWARAARRWASIASPTRRSTPGTRGRPAASCRRASLSRAEVWLFVLVSSAALVFAAAQLNPLCLALSPVALLVILGYSYTKRFTALSHVVPRAWRSRSRRSGPGSRSAAASTRRRWSWRWPCWPGSRASTRSTPARTWSSTAAKGCTRFPRAARCEARAARRARRFTCSRWRCWPACIRSCRCIRSTSGVSRASRCCSRTSIRLVRADDLSRVDAAFFTVNGWISVGYLATTAASRWLTL